MPFALPGQTIIGRPGRRLVTGFAIGGGTPTPISPALGAYVLPANAVGGVEGKGFTCTGLARLPDGSWAVGNDGRKPGEALLNSSVVRLSADFTTVLGEASNVSLGYSSGFSVQGVALIGDKIGYIRKKPGTGTGNGDQIGLLNLDLTPFSIRNFPLNTANYNGLAYDSKRDLIVVSTDTGISWRNLSDLAAASPTRAFSTTGVDQLFYRASDDRLIVTGGSNGSPGVVRVYNAETLALEATFNIPEVTSIEGIVEINGRWAICNDLYFHGTNPTTDTNHIRVIDKLG